MSGFNEVKLKDYQYLIKCAIHGDHVSSKYYDKSNNLLNKCKCCIYQEKIYNKVNNDKYYTKDKIFNSSDKILVNCLVHGNYYASPTNLINSKFRCCHKCILEDNKIRCEQKKDIYKKVKKCNKCKIEKDLNEFNKYYRKDENTYRIGHLCKKCQKEKDKNFRKKDYGSDKYNQRINKYRNSVKYAESQHYLYLRRGYLTITNIDYYNCDNCCKVLIKKADKKNYKKICIKCKELGIRKKFIVKTKETTCKKCNKIHLSKNANSYCKQCIKEKKVVYNKKYNKTETCKNIKNQRDGHKKRCELYGGHYERLNRKTLFKRDKYKCQECGIKTKFPTKENYNDLDCATIGHIVPLSLGGSHTYSNTQCECRNCNNIKGNRIINPLQLKLNL